MNDVLVLCYHAVSDRWRSSLAVSTGRLAEQVGALVRAGFTPATFTRAVLDPPAQRTLAVTFDDAYLSILEHGRPVLDRLGVPATVFAPTGPVDAGQPLAWDGTDQWLDTEHRAELTPMGWDALRDLAAGGWEVGSHTVSHPRLTVLDDDALDRELRESRAACARGMRAACESLAYPYGDVDERVVAAAARAGYRTAGTLPARLHRARPLAYPRVGVYERDDPRRFRLKTARPLRRLRASAGWELLDAVRRG